MTTFENPPSQQIAALHTRRDRLVALSDAYVEWLLAVSNQRPGNPRWVMDEGLARLAAQVTAYELVIARLDRDIERLEAELATELADQPSDTSPKWKLPNPSILPGQA